MPSSKEPFLDNFRKQLEHALDLLGSVSVLEVSTAHILQLPAAVELQATVGAETAAVELQTAAVEGGGSGGKADIISLAIL